MTAPDLLCIVGPTASGKTALAAALALRFGGEVVSCDSMQLYRGMDIGTAKPDLAERRGVPHHMLDCADPREPWTAGRYARAAENCISDIRTRGKLPIVCGGSGLYLRALTEGLSEIPDCPPREHGADAYARLQAVDPETAARLTAGDTQRITRALDVYDATGHPLSYYHQAKPEPRFNARCLGLHDPTRETLYRRIDERAELMLKNGLLKETRRLLDEGLSPDAPPMTAIGYREAVAFLRRPPAEQNPEQRAAMLDELRRSTRRYAKRQMTWFRNQIDALWVDISNVNSLCQCTEFVEKFEIL